MIKSKYNKHKETIHNFIWRAIQIVAKQGITFLIFILCAKLLSPYDFGIYNYALAIVFFLIIFGDFGISTATSKYVAEYNVTDKNKLKSVLFNSGIIILGLTIIISILTLIIGPWYLKEKYVYVLFILPLLFFSPMTSLYDGIYRGLKRFKALAIISTIIGILSIPIVYFLVKQYGLIGALIAQNVFYIILLIGLALGYREFHFKVNKEVMRQVGNYSFVFGIATLGYYLFSRIDILILGHFGYIKEIAYYELLNKLFIVLLTPFAIIGQVIAPNFTALYVKKEYRMVYSKLKKYIFYSIISGILFAIVSSIIVLIAVKLFFNNYYDYTLFIILIPCIVIYAFQVYVTYINSGIIVATGHAKLMTWLNIWMAITNIIVCLTLLHYFGFIGVIYGTAISIVVGSITLHSQYYIKIRTLAKNRGNEEKSKA